MHHTIPEIPIHKKFAKFGKRKKSDKLLRLYARLINSTHKSDEEWKVLTTRTRGIDELMERESVCVQLNKIK